MYTDALGRARSKTNSYTELQTGISVADPSGGAWVDSDPDFEIQRSGYAAALRCQHRLIVAPNINNPDGVLDCLMPDGQQVTAVPLGLVLRSPATGQRIQICAPKDCAGRLTAPNEITFPDAFDGLLKGSVRIRNERGRFIRTSC